MNARSRTSAIDSAAAGPTSTGRWMALVAALAAGRFGRRLTYAVMCLASTAALVWLYQFHDAFGGRFLLATGVVGGVTAAFYGWFPLYLPELFATSVRATSQGFAYNFGHVLAAVGTLQTAPLMALFGGSFAMAGTVLSSIYLLGLAVILFAPATTGLAAAPHAQSPA